MVVDVVVVAAVVVVTLSVVVVLVVLVLVVVTSQSTAFSQLGGSPQDVQHSWNALVAPSLPAMQAFSSRMHCALRQPRWQMPSASVSPSQRPLHSS